MNEWIAAGVLAVLVLAIDGAALLAFGMLLGGRPRAHR